MEATHNNGGLQPLYVRIPKPLHNYLDELKDNTGISKSDSVTLILMLATRLISTQTIMEMFDDYMLNDGNEIQLDKITLGQ